MDATLMASSFWKHLQCLSDAHKTLEKECAEMRAVIANVQKAHVVNAHGDGGECANVLVGDSTAKIIDVDDFCSFARRSSASKLGNGLKCYLESSGDFSRQGSKEPFFEPQYSATPLSMEKNDSDYMLYELSVARGTESEKAQKTLVANIRGGVEEHNNKLMNDSVSNEMDVDEYALMQNSAVLQREDGFYRHGEKEPVLQRPVRPPQLGKIDSDDSACSSRAIREATSDDSVFLSQVSLDSLHGPEERWKRLVKVMIARARETCQPLQCWISSVWASHGLKHIIRAMNQKIGSQIQDQDPIIKEWLGSTRHRKVFGFRKSRMSLVERVPTEDSYAASNYRRKELTANITSRLNLGTMHPRSKFRIYWSILGFVFVAYDAIMLTLQVFEPKESGPTIVIGWALRVFWAMDVIVSFRTGFYVRSKYEDRPIRIAKKYATTWLAIDLIALLPDLFVAVVDSSGTEQANYQGIEKLRLFRLLRFLRVAKFAYLMHNILDSLNSFHAALFFHLLKYSLLLICWVHVCGCAWYYIGKDADESWLIDNNVEHFQLPRIYFIAVQFTLSQLQGNTDIYPSRTSKERAFNVVMVLLSIFLMAIFISNITNVLIAMQKSWDHKSRQMRALQEYLHRHQVSADVSESVRKYSEEKMKIERKLHLDEDDVTDCLPKALRRSLLLEVRGPMASAKNVVFVALQKNLPECFEKICCDMLLPHFVIPDAVVYDYGEDCKTTYFSVAGDLVYDHIYNNALTEFLFSFGERRTSSAVAVNTYSRRSRALSESFEDKGTISRSVDVAGRRIKSLTEGTIDMNPLGWLEKTLLRERLHAKPSLVNRSKISKPRPLCEAAMWTDWSHKGDLTALSHAAFLVLKSEALSLLAEHDPTLREFCGANAIRFSRVLSSGELVATDLITSSDILSMLQDNGELPASTPVGRHPGRDLGWLP